MCPACAVACRSCALLTTSAGAPAAEAELRQLRSENRQLLVEKRRLEQELGAAQAAAAQVLALLNGPLSEAVAAATAAEAGGGIQPKLVSETVQLFACLPAACIYAGIGSSGTGANLQPARGRRLTEVPASSLVISLLNVAWPACLWMAVCGRCTLLSIEACLALVYPHHCLAGEDVRIRAFEQLIWPNCCGRLRGGLLIHTPNAHMADRCWPLTCYLQFCATCSAGSSSIT